MKIAINHVKTRHEIEIEQVRIARSYGLAYKKGLQNKEAGWRLIETTRVPR